MADICLIVLCGLPGVGKSSFAAKLLNKLLGKEKSDNNFHDMHPICICYDDIVPTDLYTKNFTDSATWKQYRKAILEFAEMIIASHKCLANECQLPADKNDKLLANVMNRVTLNHTCPCLERITSFENCHCEKTQVIIIDDNMFYSSMRYEYYKIARKYQIGFFQIHLSCDMEMLLQRNSNRSEPVGEETITRMNSKFEIPNKLINDWEKDTLFVSTGTDENEDGISQMMQMLTFCLKNPIMPILIDEHEEKEKCREINIQNILHQADLVLRKYVSQHVQQLKNSGTSKNELKKSSTELALKKKNFLLEVKSLPKLLNHLDSYFSAEEKVADAERESKNTLVCSNDSTKYNSLQFDSEVSSKETLTHGFGEGFQMETKCLFSDYVLKGDLESYR